MVYNETQYVCSICHDEFLDRESAEKCFCSHAKEGVTTKKYYYCGKCDARFKDFESARLHDRFCLY